MVINHILKHRLMRNFLSQHRSRERRVNEIMQMMKCLKEVEIMAHLRAGQASLSDTHFAGT